jgi:hypothetical protein
VYSNYTQLPAALSALTVSETVIFCNYDAPVPALTADQGKVIRGIVALANSAAAIVSVIIKCRGIPAYTVASPAQGNVPLAGGTTANLSNYTQIGGSTQEQMIAASGDAVVAFGFQDVSGVAYAYYMVTATAGTGADLTPNDGYVEIFMPEPYGTTN